MWGKRERETANCFVKRKKKMRSEKKEKEPQKKIMETCPCRSTALAILSLFAITAGLDDEEFIDIIFGGYLVENIVRHAEFTHFLTYKYLRYRYTYIHGMFRFV